MSPDHLVVDNDTHVYDLLGVGFGPSNLAVAVALVDHWSELKTLSDRVVRDVLFIEKSPSFQWHSGMLIPGTRMQISFLKDLATLRQPTSPFTFVSYLHSKNRLATFINRGSTTPSRREFSDYLAWAALEIERRGVSVAYSEEVVALTECGPGLLEVISRCIDNQAIVRRRSKSIVLSTGGVPRIPAPLSCLSAESVMFSPPIFHTANYMHFINPILERTSLSAEAISIAVIGSGQSAAEVLLDLHQKLAFHKSSGPPHQIDLLMRRGSLKPSDDSPFVNEIFDPRATDEFFSLSPLERAAVHSEYSNTNYSVVNARTIDQIYEILYDQAIDDDHPIRQTQEPAHSRIILHKYQQVVSAANTRSPQGGAMITLTLQNTLSKEYRTVSYHAVICGTGYSRHLGLQMLQASVLSKYFGLDDRDSSPGDIEVVPASYKMHSNVSSVVSSDDEPRDPDIITNSPRSSIASQTPPTSFTLPQPEQGKPGSSLQISRQYRLIPTWGEFKGRIYLQGSEESSHGLSDTLLSVGAVRAGEIVNDLWRNIPSI